MNEDHDMTLHLSSAEMDVQESDAKLGVTSRTIARSENRRKALKTKH
jgi:hypothetical protein